MTTTYRRTTGTALALAATATVLLGLSAPAAHATQADAGCAGATSTRPLTDIGELVAFRKAEQSQYLVDQGLLALR